MTQQPENNTELVSDTSGNPAPKNVKIAAELDERQLDGVAGGVEQTRNIGSQSSGAGAGKVAFNPF
jgi:hypothetical protein